MPSKDVRSVGHIWKFELGMGYQEVEMPPGAKLLHVAEQRNRPTLWAACDPMTPATMRRMVRVVMTGEPEPADAQYVGTVILEGGDFVVHVYDEGEKP
jgi:hypothetical protein